MSKETHNEAFNNTVFKVILSSSEIYEIRVGQENVLDDMRLTSILKTSFKN